MISDHIFLFFLIDRKVQVSKDASTQHVYWNMIFFPVFMKLSLIFIPLQHISFVLNLFFMIIENLFFQEGKVKTVAFFIDLA